MNNRFKYFALGIGSAYFALTLTSWQSLDAASCPPLNKLIQYYLKNLRYDDATYEKVFGASPQAKKAEVLTVERHLKQRGIQGEHVLDPMFEDEIEEVALSWAEHVAANSSTMPAWGSATSNIPLRRLSEMVVEFEYQGKKYVGRSIDPNKGTINSILEGRNSLMAAKVDRLFGFNVFPDFQFVKVNGQVYVVTDFLEGSPLSKSTGEFATAQIFRLLKQGEISDQQWWTLQALMFLIGNIDSEGVNIFLTTDQRLIFIDQGFAFNFARSVDFSDRAADSRFDYAPLGWLPPQKYPRQFIAALKKLSRDDWDDLLIDEAHDVEVDLLYARQQFILEDVKMRKNDALF